MQHRTLSTTMTRTTGLGVMGALALSLIAAPLAGQAPRPVAAQATPAGAANNNWTPPKTPWGDPDLQGIYTSDDYIGVPMQRPETLGTRLFATEEEIAAAQARIANNTRADSQEFAPTNGNVSTGPPSHWIERARRPARQTSLIVEPENGRLPARTAEGAARGAVAAATKQGASTARPEDSWEGYTHYIRCITRGIGGSVLPVIYGNGTEIVQGPGYVAILQEMVHEARIVRLDRSPHVGSAIKTYMGDSRGYFEGNTLVIETTNFKHDQTAFGGNGAANANTPGISDAAKITERLLRIDKDTVQYTMRVEDAKTYTAPFTISFPIRQEPGYQNFEYACHEGNHGMMNQLSAARADERAAAEAARQRP